MKIYIQPEFEELVYKTENIMITISSASSTTFSVNPSSTPGTSSSAASTIPKTSDPSDNSGWGPPF